MKTEFFFNIIFRDYNRITSFPPFLSSLQTLLYTTPCSLSNLWSFFFMDCCYIHTVCAHAFLNVSVQPAHRLMILRVLLYSVDYSFHSLFWCLPSQASPWDSPPAGACILLLYPVLFGAASFREEWVFQEAALSLAALAPAVSPVSPSSFQERIYLENENSLPAVHFCF